MKKTLWTNTAHTCVEENSNTTYNVRIMAEVKRNSETPKRTRKKLKDRIAELSASEIPVETFSTVSKRRKNKAPVRRTDAIATVSKSAARATTPEKKKEISKKEPVLDYATSPETISNIRIHLGLKEKSHHLVDLQATYRPVLEKPKKKRSVTGIDFMLAPATTVASEFETKNIEEPIVQHAFNASKSIPTPQSTRKKKLAVPKKTSVKNIETHEIEWDRPYHWLSAIRFGAVALFAGAVIIGFSAWKTVSSDIAHVHAMTKYAFEKTTASMNELFDGGDDEKNKNASSDAFGALGTDWKAVADTVSDMSAKHSGLLSVTGLAGLTDSVAESTETVAELFSHIDAITKKIDALHSVSETYVATPVHIKLHHKGPVVYTFTQPFGFSDIRTMRILVSDIGDILKQIQSVSNAELFSVWLSAQDSAVQQTIKAALADVPEYGRTVRTLERWLDVYESVVYDTSEGLRRYVVVFQNPRELRATGGFMGALAEMTFINGNVSEIVFPAGGPYDFQAGAHTYRPAPEGLDLMRPAMQLQDANWWFDYPTSAKEIIRLYEESAGTTVDGVIAVNASVLPSMLDLIGPIDMSEEARILYPGLPKTVDADSILSVIETTENMSSKKTPKAPLAHVLGSIWGTIGVQLRSNTQDVLPGMITMLGDSILKKDVQVYSVHADAQALIEDVSMDGSVVSRSGDQFGCVESTVGGGKTSQYITRSLHRHIIPQLNGSVRVKNTLTRSYEQNNEFSDQNVTFMRCYIPSNATNVSLSGTDDVPPSGFFSSRDVSGAHIDITLPNTLEGYISKNMPGVVSGWSLLRPNETDTLTVSYVIPDSPIDDNNRYAYVLWKQSGVTLDVTQEIELSDAQTIRHATDQYGVWDGAELRIPALTGDSAGLVVWR